MNTLFKDLLFVLRQLRRSPGFAITAILILALGIAANVIVFGVVDALILRPLDLPNQDRVMTLARGNQTYPNFSYPEVSDVRDGNTVFSAVAAFVPVNFGLEANGATHPVWGFEVSGQYFEAVAIKPFLGRMLEPQDDDHPDASQAAVLSWPAWKNEFAADPDVVGKTVRINKHPYTIVGVTPAGFYGTEKFLQPALFVPMANQATLDGWSWRDTRSAQDRVWSIVRIKDGVSAARVQADLNTVAARMAQQNPKEEEGLALKLVRPGLAGDFLGAPARGFLAGVMGLAGIVLLAACANLGSLFAARTADRAREIAIRMAVGSSRWRIVRQVLMEALVISALGGGCACSLAWLAISGLASWHPPSEFPVQFHIEPRPSLILAASLISLVAGVIFGLMPLRQIFKTDPNEAIKSGGSQSYAGRRWALRDFLLAAQIALCCVTVTAGFVSLRGLGKVLTMDMGFNPKNAVVTKFELRQAGYSDDAAEHFQRQLLERVSQLPGVEAAAYANATPLINSASSAVFSQQAADFRPSQKAFDKYDYIVSPGYFTAAGTPLLAGRDLNFTDTANTPLVAVVNREFAWRMFHTDHAVGLFFKDGAGRSIQIVGIAADGKNISISEEPQAEAFFPVLQSRTTETALIVRIAGSTGRDASRAATADMAASIRKTIRDLDPAIPLQESGAWKDQLSLSLFPAQAATVALGLFGAFGLLLSITGTFGLASYTVSKRLRELSIRVALGAQAKQVLAAALGRMLVLLGSGAMVGMMLGVLASRVLSAIVYQASAQDPLVIAAVAFTIMLTGTLSVTGPVRRVLHVDPSRLLREQ